MIRMEVKGLDELERQLMALGEKVATKVLRDAGREALKVVEEDMKQHAGFDETSAGRTCGTQSKSALPPARVKGTRL